MKLEGGLKEGGFLFLPKVSFNSAPALVKRVDGKWIYEALE